MYSTTVFYYTVFRDSGTCCAQHDLKIAMIGIFMILANFQPVFTSARVHGVHKGTPESKAGQCSAMLEEVSKYRTLLAHRPHVEESKYRYRPQQGAGNPESRSFREDSEASSMSSLSLLDLITPWTLRCPMLRLPPALSSAARFVVVRCRVSQAEVACSEAGCVSVPKAVSSLEACFSSRTSALFRVRSFSSPLTGPNFVMSLAWRLARASF